MKEKIKYLMSTRAFHLCVVIVMIATILFVLGIIILKYSVEGETNMPFNLNKITIISSQEGIDKEAGENRWAFDISQNNDIYLYIDKNKDYKDQEAIKSILIDSIRVEKEQQIEKIKFYKPNGAETGGIFSNTAENEIQTIEYVGGMESNLKKLEISNQGGVVAFRYANDKIAEYTSNEEEINHNDLLKNTGITEEQLKAKINFDLTIKIESGKEYKTNISLEMPIQGVLEKGTTSKEITDLKDIVFKRTKN